MTEQRLGEQVRKLFEYRFDAFRTRLDGLTDDEYLWEPVPDCLSVRGPSEDGFRADPIAPWWSPNPRITTIAWRLWHLTSSLASHDVARIAFQGAGGPRRVQDPPGTAAEALGRLDRGKETWLTRMGEVNDVSMWRPLGEAAGQFAADPVLAFTLHVTAEMIHHGAEISLLRDIYHWSVVRTDPFVTACLAGDRSGAETLRSADSSALLAANPQLLITAAESGGPEVLRLLAEHGLPVNMAGRVSALHVAAARGDMEVVRTLIELGADVTAKDPIYQTNPSGWAYRAKIASAASTRYAAGR